MQREQTCGFPPSLLKARLRASFLQFLGTMIHTRESQQMILEELGNICYSLRQQYNCPLLCVILKQNDKGQDYSMKKTGIMTDSHSGILENEASKLGIAVLPMPFLY